MANWPSQCATYPSRGPDTATREPRGEKSGLATKLATLEAERDIESLSIEKAIGHPQFSALLQRTLLNSAETENSAKHDLLASLVAARLLVESDTTLALASGLASDAIARSTSRQIKLMALCSIIDEVRPRVIRTFEEYKLWLQACLSPFADFEFKEIDARHLVAIACASYDPTSGRSLQAWLAMKLGRDLSSISSRVLNMKIEDLPELDTLNIYWIEGLAGVALTSVGSIVGALAYDQLMGVRTGLPRWN